MAKRKSKKLNTVALAAVAATLVFLALAVTGMLIDWVSVPNIGHGLGEALGQDAPERIGFTLAECATEWEVEEYNAMNALAIVTVVAAALTFVGAAATMITGNKLVKFAAMALGAVTLVCAIIAIVLTYSYCDNTLIALADGTPAIGAWLLTIGGALCGLAGAAAAIKS